MEKEINVYRCGTEVTSIMGVIVNGFIVGVLLQTTVIKYLVSYNNNGTVIEVYLEDFQFKVVNGRRQTIGFAS